MIIKRVEHAIRVFLKSKPSANESKVLGYCRLMYKSCMKLNTSKFNSHKRKEDVGFSACEQLFISLISSVVDRIVFTEQEVVE